MFKDNDILEVYTKKDNNIYLPTVTKNGTGYVVEASKGGEGIPCYVSWADIKYINRISSVFKTGSLRFAEEFEEEAFKELRININKAQYFTREKIEDMILNTTDDILKEILEIKDIMIIDEFVAILTMLENTNEYDISNKAATYIRARQEELVKGVKATELTVTPTKPTPISAREKAREKAKAKADKEKLDKENK